MNELEKDKAIYRAMCEIADKYFLRLIESEEKFKKFMAGKLSIPASELFKNDFWKDMEGNVEYDTETITVGSFSCEFHGNNVWHLMQKFKSIAKEKEHVFTYEEKIDNVFVGSAEITFDNPSIAKNIANRLAEDDWRPIMNCVLMEINTIDHSVNFVASNGRELVILSNFGEKAASTESENGNFQALFTKSDWKRICDYSRKAKSPVKFDIYRRKEVFNKYKGKYEKEHQDTMVAHLGDATIKSTVFEQWSYPKWRKVLPDTSKIKTFTIHPDDVKAMNEYIKGISKATKNVTLSFYRGSELMYLDYEFCGDRTTATFRLTRPSEVTIGNEFPVKSLKKGKFRSLSFEKSSKATYFDDADTDICLIMPNYPKDGVCVYDVEKREIASVLVA